MSRIGKKPIVIPKGVTVNLKGDDIAVKGPKGTLTKRVPPNVKIDVGDKEIHVSKAGKGRRMGGASPAAGRRVDSLSGTGGDRLPAEGSTAEAAVRSGQ